ncbi:MAG: tetratricopeptide repeat protein [Bacteroidota bacterium]
MKQSILGILLLFSLSGQEGFLTAASEAVRLGKYEQAIQSYQEALGRYPNLAGEIHYNLAQCYIRMDSTGQALRYFRQAAASRNLPLRSRAMNNVGRMMAAQDQLREAQRAFRSAIEADASNETARFNYELVQRLLEEDDPPPPKQNDEQSDNPPPPSPQNNLSEMQQQLLLNYEGPIYGDEARSRQDTLPVYLAERLLEDMRRNPRQYIQQLRRTFLLPKTEERPAW